VDRSEVLSTSRLYVASSVWPSSTDACGGTEQNKVGPSEQWGNFMGPVM